MTMLAGGGSPPGTSLAPVPSQSIDFGRLTLVGDGAATLVSNSFTITSITLGTRTTGSNHFTTSGNTIVPTAVPSDAAYMWTGCTATGPSGTSPQFTLTINTIANGYSISDDADFTAVLALSTATTAGKTFYARTNTFSAKTITNTWASDCTLTKHSGASPIFQYFDFNGATHFVCDGIEVYQNISGSQSLIDYGNGASDLTFRNVTVHAKYFDPTVDRTHSDPAPTQVTGIAAYVTTPGAITIQNCTFYDLYRGCVLASTSTITVTGNVVHTVASDGFIILGPYTAVPMPTVTITGNQISDMYSTSDSDHSDGIQFLANSGTGDMTVTCSYNAIVQTTAVVDYATTAQGIFGDFGALFITGTFEGNFVAVGGTTSLSIETAKSLTVKGNTLVRCRAPGGSFSPILNIGDAGTSGTHIIENNVAESIFAGGSPTMTNNCTLENNVGTCVTTGSTGICYASAFNGVLGSFQPATLAQAIAMFYMKTGGPLDQSTDIGAIPTYMS